jgi:hypothetical protein
MNEPPLITVSFMNQLAALVPEAAEVIKARRREQGGEFMPYAEMEDLVKWLGSMSAQSRGSGETAARARAVLRKFLGELESRFEVGDQEIDNLIALGFLEGLRLAGSEFPSIRALLPSRMSAWFALACE